MIAGPKFGEQQIYICCECVDYSYFRIDKNGLESSNEEHLRIIGIDLL
jgi:hypothetical protein